MKTRTATTAPAPEPVTYETLVLQMEGMVATFNAASRALTQCGALFHALKRTDVRGDDLKELGHFLADTTANDCDCAAEEAEELIADARGKDRPTREIRSTA